MIPWPQPTAGSSIVGAFLNRLLGRCKQEQLLESTLFRKIYTTQGFFLQPKFQTTIGTAKAGAPITLFLCTQLAGNDTVGAQQVLSITMGNVPGQNNPIPLISSLGAAVPIAKWPAQRPGCYLVQPEIFDNVQVSYTQAPQFAPPAITPDGYNDNNRVATIAGAGGATENQVVFPRYTTAAMCGALVAPFGYQFNQVRQALVVAVQSTQTGLFDNQGNQISWLELPQRVWAKRFQ